MPSESSNQHNNDTKGIEGIKVITSNELRLSIVKLLNEKGPSNIGSISSNLNRSRQLIKHHVLILERSKIIAQKNYGSLKVYELTEFGKRLLAKIQDEGVKKESEKKPYPKRLYRIGITLAVSLIPLIFATVRFIFEKTHPLWILGGAIISLAIYYVFSKVWKRW